MVEDSLSMKLSAAVCTSMQEDIGPLLNALILSDCDEILLVGTEGHPFPAYDGLHDSRVRIVYTDHLLSYKRKKSFEEATGDIVAFIDDDAIPPPQWPAEIRQCFNDPAVGIATGPSLLKPDASLWKRTAQLAMMSSQYSHRRYYPSEEGYVDWFSIIGANMAYRMSTLDTVEFSPHLFPVQGEEMYLAHLIKEKNWKIWYNPRAFVYHEPHPFFRQIKAIHKWGRSEIRLLESGVAYPQRDPAFFFFIPTLCIFALAYVWGELVESVKLKIKS